MIEFNDLYKKFEKTNDLCGFCEKYKNESVATRFLLVRSLKGDDLKHIIENYSKKDAAEGNLRQLTEKAYNSKVTIDQLVKYIENARPGLIQERESELGKLPEVLATFPVVNCGVRNDNINDILNDFVRNKSLKTMDALEAKMNNEVLPKIRQYGMWSYYNQTSNDIIELCFLKHSAVIPTLRKIHNIDFFIKVGNEIIPFDLKFTHISDSYFDLASQGIVRNTSELARHDDFCIGENPDPGESKKIKCFYKMFKHKNKNLNLPNLKGLTKSDLLNNLQCTREQEAIDFVSEVIKQHAGYVPTATDIEKLWQLEWWNYKYQGERLFCNNNRLFVFLAYKKKFVDGRELKGRTTEIGQQISSLLDSLSKSSIHTIRYHYDKDVSLAGDYTALSLSTIYSE